MTSSHVDRLEGRLSLHSSSDSPLHHQKLFTEGGIKMKTLSKIFLTNFACVSLRFLIIVLLPGLMTAFLLFSGCARKQTGESKPVITLQNLETAYSRESRISREYSLFSKKAEMDHYSAVANLYKAASRSEAIHAEMAAALLRSKGVEVKPYVPDSIAVGTVVQTLHLAVSDEALETESMYPNLARTAELEKFPEAAESFRKTLTADRRHAELFKGMLDKGGSPHMNPYYVCPECGYIITSEKVDECPGCHLKKEKFEKI